MLNNWTIIAENVNVFLFDISIAASNVFDLIAARKELMN